MSHVSDLRAFPEYQAEKWNHHGLRLS
ncbi:hypothetical protein PSEUDO8AS_70114 [Pseudomonas sp. 8AS]|nr:hypothetical protein PSEUDO8AS_70114 [Pseudomonas sp. 8AS]